MRYKITLVILFCFFVSLPAQNHNHNQTGVSELWDFHEVIYQIWHKAWPNKNIDLLKNLIPEIDRLAAPLYAAKLPHILHQKEGKWQAGIEELKSRITDYKSAAVKDDSEFLLKAAEDLHTAFEHLVKILRPALPELDNFHLELYQLYHYHYPNFELDKIKKSTDELKKRMIKLNQAELAQKYESLQQQFNKARSNLAKSVEQLHQIVYNSSDKEKITTAIENMHSDYQKLQHIFN